MNGVRVSERGGKQRIDDISKQIEGNAKCLFKMEKTINLNRCGLFSYNYITIMIYTNNLMWLVRKNCGYA